MVQCALVPDAKHVALESTYLYCSQTYSDYSILFLSLYAAVSKL